MGEHCPQENDEDLVLIGVWVGIIYTNPFNKAFIILQQWIHMVVFFLHLQFPINICSFRFSPFLERGMSCTSISLRFVLFLYD